MSWVILLTATASIVASIKEKTCPKCKNRKPVSEFSLCKSNKDGLQVYCIICRRHTDFIKRLKQNSLIEYNLGKSSPIVRKCKTCNVEKYIYEFFIAESCKDGRRKECKECHTSKNKKRYYTNIENNREWHRNHYHENAESKKAKINERYHLIKNEESYQQQRKIWRSNYLESVKDCPNYKIRRRESHNKWRSSNPDYYKDRWRSDHMFRFKSSLRCRTLLAFTNMGYDNGTSIHKLLGASWEVVKKHIERQFTNGMSWSNYGEWHIDHIIPLATAKTEAELIRLCHYRNLQPLWAKDNLSKGAKIIEPVQTYLPL